MPRCFGVPKLRHETARAGRRLSAFASPYLVMQSGLRHRHSADFGWESRPEEYIKGRDGKLAGATLLFFGKSRNSCFVRRRKDNFGLECKRVSRGQIALWRLSHEKSLCPVITTMQRERLKYELWLSCLVGNFALRKCHLRLLRLFQALVNTLLQLLTFLFEPCQFV